MDADKLARVREALDVYAPSRREQLLEDRESELTRFLIRLGAYADAYFLDRDAWETYYDWGSYPVGSGTAPRIRDGIRPDPTLPGDDLAPLVGWASSRGRSWRSTRRRRRRCSPCSRATTTMKLCAS